MTETLWAGEAFVAASGGRPVGPPVDRITGISIDSRTLVPGDVFFAIKGDRFDGHDYVSAALAAGASVAVVAQERLVALGHLTGSLIVVDDVMEGLRSVARAARARFRGKVIGVTGSAGKTSTKNMLRLALAKSANTHAASASFNNHWGVPLTLARMPEDAGFGVFEIGMNHPGEITPLTEMVRPHVAIITTVDAVHLAAFDSVEDIARAKAEIFTGVVPGGAAILNRDNPHFELLFKLALAAEIEHIISFGRHENADARLDDVTLGAGGSRVWADIGGRKMDYALGAPGLHMVMNSLATLAAVQFVGGDLDAAAAALAGFSAGKGRGERVNLAVDGGRALLIDESYNANPASMRAALSLLGQVNPAGNGRRIAVLGDMLELGADEASLHSELAEPLAEAAVERVYLTGPRMASLWEALPSDRRGVYAGAVDELVLQLVEDIGPGDVLVVKGSNSIGLGALVEALKRHFGVEALGETQGS